MEEGGEEAQRELEAQVELEAEKGVEWKRGASCPWLIKFKVGCLYDRLYQREQGRRDTRGTQT